MRLGCGSKSRKIKLRETREKNGRRYFCSICARAASTSLPSAHDARRERADLAGPEIQELVVIFYVGIAPRQTALIHQHDLADSSARRIRFEAPKFVRGALIQTQAAMNAVRVIVVGGNIRAGKSALRFRCGSMFGDCGTIAHGLRFRPRIVPEPGHSAGQKEFFTRRINSKSWRAGPHTTSAEVFISEGHHSTIAEACNSGCAHTSKTSGIALVRQTTDTGRSPAGTNAAYTIPDAGVSVATSHIILFGDGAPDFAINNGMARRAAR